MKTLSVAIIAKNEEALIGRCLQSVQGADQIVVVDTGSTDGTVGIVKEHGVTMHHFEWVDDFAAARNAALSHCTSDYVLSIDCDEYLEEGGVEKIREIIESDKDAYAVTMVAEGTNQKHYPVRLFKRSPEIKWVGEGHEAVNRLGETVPVHITYGYSPAHAQDPERMLRIMQKAVETTPNGRNYYYLAREHYYRKEYEKAIELFTKCVEVSQWLPEKADAVLTIARCHWFLSQGDDARRMGLEAVRLNPMFKEALVFLSETHFSPHKEKWLKLSESADNSDVVFVR